MIKAKEYINRIAPYIPGKPIEEVEKEFGIKDIIKLASNENPYGPSPKAQAAIAAAVAGISRYPDGSGYYLRKKLSRFHGINEDMIILGNGSDEINSMITAAYMGQGDNGLMGFPSFIKYKIAIEASGAECRMVKLNAAYGIDLKKIAKSMDANTRVVFICNPNNPTGTIVTQSEVVDFLRRTSPGVLVVLDEAYIEYVESPDFPRSFDLLRKYPNVIVLRTFSKIYGLAGLRVGYGIASESIIRDLNKVRDPFNTSSLAQAAAAAAVDDGKYVSACFKKNLKEMKFLEDELGYMKLFFVKSHSNFILADLKKDLRDIYIPLLKKGVIIRPMNSYGLNTFARITVGTREENKRLVRSLKELL